MQEILETTLNNETESRVLQKANFNVRILKQTINSITIDWELMENAEVYEIEKFHQRHGWQVVAWCSKGPKIIEPLEENWSYRFRIKALCLDEVQREYLAFSISSDFVASTLAPQPSTLCLYRSLKKGQQFLVKRLLRRRPSLIEYPGPNGYLPLANAIVFGEHAIVDTLLTAGASVHIGNPRIGRTPLHMAFYHGRLPVARILYNKRASLESQDINGMTPCHFAIDGNQLEMLKFAIDHGANMEARDGCGWTLLLRAVVMEADIGILKLLVCSGSSLNVKDNVGQTCHDLARLYKNQMAIDYFNEILTEQAEKFVIEN